LKSAINTKNRITEKGVLDMDKGKPKSSDNENLTFDNDQLGENKENRDVKEQPCGCDKGKK
jgi:hypothetical protein